MSRNSRGARGRSSSLPGALPGEYSNTSHEITDATFNSSLTSLPSHMASVRLASPLHTGVRPVSEERPASSDGGGADSRPSVERHPAVSEEEVPPPYTEGSPLASASTLNNDNSVHYPSPLSETSVNRVQEELATGSLSDGGVRVYPLSEPSRSLSGLLSESDSELGEPAAALAPSAHSPIPSNEGTNPILQSTPLPGGRAGSVELTADQLSAVQSAIMGLTPAQRDLVRRRMDAVETVAPRQEDTSDSESVASRGEGPSNLDKGKGPDPRNWGGVADMDPEELDVEAQRQAFLTFNQLRDEVNRPSSPLANEKAGSGPTPFVPTGMRAPSLAHVRFQPQPPAVDPDVTALRDEVTQLREQIALLSMMHRASERGGSQPLQNQETEVRPSAPPVFGGPSISTAIPQSAGPPRNYSISISGPSQQGAEAVSRSMMPSAQIDPTSLLGKLLGQSTAAPAFSSVGGGGGGGDPSAGMSAAASTGQPRVPVLKPRDPDKYKGNANVQAFQKFAQEATAYCSGYAIPPGSQVFRISSFLEGKAWDYYQYSMTSSEADEAELAKFLSGLFDYCFPLDFKQRMRDKLQSATQGNRSVKEFVHELNGLYIMIGPVPEPIKVQKLWYGLEGWIQSHLWWATLTPDTASWAEVQHTAELAERAKDAGDRATRRATRDSSHQGGMQPKTSGVTSRSGNRVPGTSVASGSKNTSRAAEKKGTSTRPNPRSDKQGASSSKPAQKPTANNGSGQRKPTATDTCFECGQTGHFRRNCPQLNRVQSNTKGKPPGVTNFNVEIDFGRAEELREMAESTARSDQLELNYVELALFSDEESSGPPSLQSVSDSSSEASDVAPSSLSELMDPFAEPDARPSDLDFQSDVDAAFGGDEDPFGQYPSLVREWYEQQVRVLAPSSDTPAPSVSDHVEGSDGGGDVPPELDTIESPSCMGGAAAHADWLDNLDEPLGSLVLPAVRPRGTIRRPLGFLRQAIPGVEPGDALAEGLCAALHAVCPFPLGAPRNLEPTANGQRFMCIQHQDFIEVLDNYLSFNLLVPNSVVEHPLLDLEQWYARQVHDCFVPDFDLNDLTDELSVLFGDEDSWEELERPASLVLPARCSHRAQPVDLYAAQAEALLRMLGPYFLDPARDADIDFWVEPLPDGDYRVWGAGLDDPPLLCRDWLRDADFAIAEWFRGCIFAEFGECAASVYPEPMGWALADAAVALLELYFPWPGCDEPSVRFYPIQCMDYVYIADEYLSLTVACPVALLERPQFNLPDWFAHECMLAFESPVFSLDDLEGELESLFQTQLDPCEQSTYPLELNAVGASTAPISAVQRNAATPRDFTRVIPTPAIVVVEVNGYPARALLDSGSLADFMSTRLAHQLGIDVHELEKPLPVHLAVQGSRAKVNTGCTAHVKYQRISDTRYFDIMNLLNYDLILGTPFLFQHKVTVGLNPVTIVVGSDKALPIEGKSVRALESRATDVLEEELEKARQHLREYAADICAEASNTPLPPLREINHTIPLKDPSKVYTWRGSRCPDAHLASWIEKRDAYLKSGRWRMTNARNTAPMLLLTKPGTGVNGVPPRLRVVCDLRERNANTHKLTSPLPDIEGILRRLSRKRYRSLIDGKDAYEQIRIEPAHVERTAMTSPDGNMVSLVLQQGDCNAVATYQALMNHIFGPYIGVFMDVYLDDVYIHSDTLADHVRDCKTVIDVLRREQLYLSSTKLKFLCPELKVLGRIVDDDGIRMDPNKVDSVLNWKPPTNKELLRGFLGSVGYLADDIATVRIPMGILSSLTGSNASFVWDFTHQRAFDEIKQLVHAHREHHRKPLDYSTTADPIWLVTDGSHGGIAGVISQGPDFRSGRVAAFFSAKLSSAQSNYPVHEIEMLAGVEAMLRHRDVLLGCPFTWVTDHKGLTHLMAQRKLSGRQARWMEKLSEFDFRVEYVPGVDNVLADALSRIYSNDAPGTVRAPSEYAQHDVAAAGAPSEDLANMISMPVLVGLEAMAAAPQMLRRSPRTPKPVAEGASRPQTVVPAADRPSRSRSRARSKSAPHPSAARPHSRAASTPRRVTVEEVEDEEAGLPPARVPAPRPSLPPESGRPETSREFAKRIKRVVLRVPDEGREGVGPELDKPDTQDSAGSDTPPPAVPLGDSLISILAEAPEGVDLLTTLKGCYQGDPVFGKLLKDLKNYKNFRECNGLLYLKDKGQEMLCIPEVEVNGRSVREIIISQAHSLLAHLGSHKTLGMLRDHVWWKTMVKDIQAYCDTCQTCKRSKPNNQRPYGLLHPLPVPSRPWEAIGIDFVGPLPESKDRDATYDSITTIIDLLTGMVHLVPSRTNYSAKDVAELVFSEVYKHHGLPKIIVSDRDTLFTSTFWEHLNAHIGINLRRSSAYHPESDGSTERAHRTVGQMLRQCIGKTQKDWVSKLPAIEFAINVARSDTTGYAPFFLNSGRMPRSLIWADPSKDEYPGVRAYAQRVKNAVVAAHDSIIAARVKQTRDANRRRRPAPFVEGDLIYLSTKNISLQKGQSRKLAPKFIGPYKILRDYGNYSYKVDIPADLRQRGIHDTFHASLLRVHEPNDDRLFPGRLASQIEGLEDSGDEWAINKILTHHGHGRNALFEVQWSSGDQTWLPYHTIAHLDAMKTYFELVDVDGIDRLQDGSGVPPPDDPQVFLGVIGFADTLGGVEYLAAGTCNGNVSELRSRVPYPALDSQLPLNLHPISHRTLPAMPDHINHPNLSRLKGGGDIILADPSVDNLHLRFTLPQARLYCNFDSTLRSKKFDRSSMAFPGGYDDFATLWNRAKDIPYKFCTLDKRDRTVIHGEHPDPDLIAPLPPTPTTNGPQYSEDQQEIIEWMTWANVKAQRRRDQRIESSKAQAKAKREREERERQGRVINGEWLDEGAFGAGFKKRRVDSSVPVAGPSGKGKGKEVEKETEEVAGKEPGGAVEEAIEKAQDGKQDADARMSEE
ncbi:transcription factor [Ganoderma sinense ZZ0214-1]|uniref:RNA-directed DNA polymerase n=1 Tax=Ganoderma sinense ZZ0214-1 TaxID=1077348 RepID=A0A2G8S0K2_9APHY|nr:transcription factor [Ganoderma sinense ZZ0214-1]